ncbi:MAG: DUF1330 domain-containing protein [Pseudomonadota bacterium]
MPIVEPSQSETTKMIYAFAKLTVSNPQALEEYREVAGAALAKHGGKVETASSELTILDGTPDTPNVAALLSFPDKSSAEAWAKDPDLADVHELRRSAGGSDILLIG